MRQRRDSRNIIIVVLCFVVIGMGAGFAALQANLEISGSTEIEGNQWDIHIASIEVCTNEMAQNDVNCSAPAYNATSVSANVVEGDSTKATFTTSMKAPSDKITYKVTVVNNGSLDGKLSAISFTKEPEATAPLTYSFNGVEANSTLITKTTGTNVVYVTVEYTGTTVTATDTTVTNVLDLTYIQNIAA